MMALTGLLLLELALYTSCFVCGIVAAASLTIAQGNFGGLCMLYGTVNYNATASLIGIQSSSSSSLCYFVSAISVMVAVVCFSLSLYWVYTFCIDGDVRRERVWMNLIMAVCGVFLFFLLVTGCMLKIGRDSLCNSIIQSVPNITRCEEAQTRPWASPLKGGRFYNNLYKAESAVWVNFFFWLIIGILVIVQRRQSSGSKMIVGGLGGYGGPSGGLFGDPGVTAAETEPFFNRPPRPQ
ncbi:transmembrane protein 179B [Trachinotus anak]|uniref:transmembrane protein 179B n=1 Tax=Trachinotus anak TaxID=443729 RepID=UPI0039F20F31